MTLNQQIEKLEKLIEEVRELQNSGLWENLQDAKSQLYKVLNERYRQREKQIKITEAAQTFKEIIKEANETDILHDFGKRGVTK